MYPDTFKKGMKQIHAFLILRANLIFTA